MYGAPDLILDLLLSQAQQLSSQALARAGALMEIGEVAMRVALSRLVAQGKITRDARGLYSIPRDTVALLQAVREWRRKHCLMVTWRGRWIAVQDTEVRRADKVTWRRHRLALDLWGMKELQPGLSIRPDNLRGGLAAHRRRLADVGLAGRALVFRIDGLDADALARAQGLWDVRRFATTDGEFIASLQRSRRSLRQAPLEDAIRESLLLGRDVIAYLVRDPLLPPQLMPQDVRERLLQTAEDYQATARTLWNAWLSRLSA